MARKLYYIYRNPLLSVAAIFCQPCN